MTTPYHMREVDDDEQILPEGIDVGESLDDVTRVKVDVEPPGGAGRELKCTFPERLIH